MNEIPPLRSQVAQAIRHYIGQNLLFTEGDVPFADDASLLGNGIIDSIGVLELVTFVGQEFGVTVDPSEITPENFDSVEKIAQYVERKHA